MMKKKRLIVHTYLMVDITSDCLQTHIAFKQNINLNKGVQLCMKTGYDIFSSLHVMQVKNKIFKLVSKYCTKIHDNLGLLHGQKLLL